MKLPKATKDFNINDLPSNRKEVFFDCIKNRYKYFMYSGLILFITLIPLLLIISFKSFYIGSLYNDYVNEVIDAATYNKELFSYTFTFDVLILLSSFIFSIGICGMSRLIRQIGWMEPIFFINDIKDGIKLNYKHICIHLLFMCIIYLIADVSLVIHLPINFVKYIPFIIFILVIIPLTLYNIAQTNYYNISNIKSFKNSLLFIIKTAPVCILFTLIISSIYLIRYIPNFSIKMMLYILLIIFVIPVYYFIWFLYSSFVFDKYINAEFYPEIIDKGINRQK